MVLAVTEASCWRASIVQGLGSDFLGLGFVVQGA